MNGEQRGSFISLPVSPRVYTKRVRIFAVIFVHEILLATSPSPSLEERAMKEIEGFVNVRRMFVYIYIYIFLGGKMEIFSIPLFTINE